MNITYFEPSSNTPALSVEKRFTVYMKHFFTGIFIVNVVLGVVYLMMLNGLATQGFDMESLKAEQLSHQKGVENIDILLAIPSSIYALESDELVQEMEVINHKSFISLKSDQVAYKYKKY